MLVRGALVLGFLFLSLSISASAPKQTGDSSSLRALGLSFSRTYTLVHTPEIDGVRGSRPLGVTASYAHQFLDSLSWEQCACYPRTGLLAGYFYLDDPQTLGNSFFLAGYVEPFLWTGKKIDLSIRGVFGGTYQDSPFHPEKNPENRAYSTHFSFFLQLGLHAHLRLDERNTIKLSALYDHSSNGGVSKPNKGLNHPGFAVGYERSLSTVDFPEWKERGSLEEVPAPRLDIAFFGAGKNIGPDRETLYGVGGHSIKLAQALNPLHTVTVGGEWVVDGGLKKELGSSGTEVQDPQRGSIALGHEFLMGRFIFSQELGLYLYDPSSWNDPVYHRWGLQYYPTSRFFVGINLKAHRHVADFIDFRLGFSLRAEEQ